MKIINNIEDAIPVFISAVVTDNLFAVNALLDKFPKLIELKDKRNRNVLMVACYAGKPTIVSYLISFYVIANPMLDPDVPDDDGLNAYDWAVLGGNDFARSLIAKVSDQDME
jgi:ankyrin repeat protein